MYFEELIVNTVLFLTYHTLFYFQTFVVQVALSNNYATVFSEEIE